MKKITLEELSSQDYLIDLRPAAQFAANHYKGAINVPFSANLIGWMSSAVQPSSTLVLIAEQETAESAAEPLQMAGFSVLGFILPEDLSPNDTLETITVAELAGRDNIIIDVRTPQEWVAGHIKGARHLELSQFAQKMDTIPKDQDVALICGGGNRSSVAASLLKKSGHPHVANVRGGMSAWKQARLPLEM